MPRWDKLDNNLGNTKVHITSDGTIEDALGLLQVDFANKSVIIFVLITYYIILIS